jgi:hypothetical protein
MEKMTVIGMAALVFLVAFSTGWTMDYGNMSNDELAELRGAILNAPEVERNAFQTEWEKRLRNMSEAEKERYSNLAETGLENGEEKKQPHIQGRGYDERGMGTVIHGGGGPVPPDVLPGAAR